MFALIHVVQHNVHTHIVCTLCIQCKKLNTVEVVNKHRILCFFSEQRKFQCINNIKWILTISVRCSAWGMSLGRWQ